MTKQMQCPICWGSNVEFIEAKNLYVCHSCHMPLKMDEGNLTQIPLEECEKMLEPSLELIAKLNSALDGAEFPSKMAAMTEVLSKIFIENGVKNGDQAIGGVKLLSTALLQSIWSKLHLPGEFQVLSANQFNKAGGHGE